MDNRAEAVANRIVEKMFEGRKGHGNGPCVERHLHRADLFEIVKLAYELGFEHGSGKKVESR